MRDEAEKRKKRRGKKKGPGTAMRSECSRAVMCGAVMGCDGM